jgi:hypothetical protein
MLDLFPRQCLLELSYLRGNQHSWLCSLEEQVYDAIGDYKGELVLGVCGGFAEEGSDGCDEISSLFSVFVLAVWVCLGHGMALVAISDDAFAEHAGMHFQGCDHADLLDHLEAQCFQLLLHAVLLALWLLAGGLFFGQWSHVAKTDAFLVDFLHIYQMMAPIHPYTKYLSLSCSTAAGRRFPLLLAALTAHTS